MQVYNRNTTCIISKRGGIQTKAWCCTLLQDGDGKNTIPEKKTANDCVSRLPLTTYTYGPRRTLLSYDPTIPRRAWFSITHGVFVGTPLVCRMYQNRRAIGKLVA